MAHLLRMREGACQVNDFVMLHRGTHASTATQHSTAALHSAAHCTWATSSWAPNLGKLCL